jgi:hypothetical protein
VHLKAQAPTWMDLSSLQVYGNGRPIPLAAANGALTEEPGPVTGTLVNDISTAIPIAGAATTDPIVRADVTITLTPTVDTWYVFVVRGTSSLNPVGNGSPFSYTNPLYVDVDGGGFTSLQPPPDLTR